VEFARIPDAEGILANPTTGKLDTYFSNGAKFERQLRLHRKIRGESGSAITVIDRTVLTYQNSQT
jgi:hypothetical protein